MRVGPSFSGSELALWVGVGQAPAQKRERGQGPAKKDETRRGAICRNRQAFFRESQQANKTHDTTVKTTVGCTPSTTSTLPWNGQGQLTNERNQHEAKQPTWRTKNARLACLYALNVVHQSTLSTFIPGGATTLGLHRERRQRRRHLRHALRNHREHNVPLDNTATSPVTGKHIHDNTTTTGSQAQCRRRALLFNAFSTAPHSCRSLEITVRENESEDSHLDSSREECGVPPCYPRVLQCTRECSENQRRARILSTRAEEDDSHDQRRHQQCRPQCRRMCCVVCVVWLWCVLCVGCVGNFKDVRFFPILNFGLFFGAASQRCPYFAPY